MISEEGEHDPGGASCFWLVDPLDGTRAFLHGGDSFSVNIALIDDTYPCFGLIHLPASGILYQGGASIGAWRGRTPIHATRGVAGVCRMLVSPGQVDASHEEFRTRLQALAITTMIEAKPGAIKFCRVAEGNADIYPRRTRTCGWDSAAGQAILEAAGGAVYDAAWRRFAYEYHPQWFNGDFIAVADPVWRERLESG